MNPKPCAIIPPPGEKSGLVLIVSKGLSNSGAIELIAKQISRFGSSLQTHIAAMATAFLTPIEHKNNTLIMGPGGYRFGDYWRMGLPLEILIILVSIPMIMWIWPLQG